MYEQDVEAPTVPTEPETPGAPKPDTRPPEEQPSEPAPTPAEQEDGQEDVGSPEE